MMADIQSLITSCGGSPEDVLLMVDVRRQILVVWRGGTERGRYPVSTSRFGTGGEPGSNRTPIGLHRVVERYGDGEPPGRVFKTREATREILSRGQWRDDSDHDRILTRILRLEGLESNRNEHSYNRYIYLHGTNQEHLIGAPASHGCIRLRNEDMVALFDQLKGRDVYCWIGEDENHE
jgi:hypothetical protein